MGSDTTVDGMKSVGVLMDRGQAAQLVEKFARAGVYFVDNSVVRSVWAP
jgi:hypothetical protein